MKFAVLGIALLFLGGITTSNHSVPT